MNDFILAGEELRGRGGHDAGRELLSRLYRDAVGGEIPSIAVAERGKPYFVDSPWYFSISHTHNHVFCALAKHPIGIDAEEADRDISLRLAEKILSPGEKARFDAAPDKREAMLKFWVLKEASVKLSGEGLRGYPNHTDFSPDDPRVQMLHGCFVAVLQVSSL